MRSMIDIILAQQRTALQLSINELHRVLEDDDNWRALAALESVGEASGGIAAPAWMARRDELVAALLANPAYRLSRELERAVAVVWQSANQPAHEGSARASITEFVPAPALATSGAAHLPPPPAGLRAEFGSFEPRRESIAARIAALPSPVEAPAAAAARAIDPGTHTVIVDAHEKPGSAGPSANAAPPAPDVVAAASQNILASILPAVAFEPAGTEPETYEPGATESLPPSGDPSIVTSVDVQSGDAAADVSSAAEDDGRTGFVHDDLPGPSPTGCDPLFQSGIEARESEVAAVVVQDDLWDQEFEAEVSIVVRSASESSGTTRVIDGAAKDGDDDAGLTGSETLEERLQRLDRQSAGLVRTPSKDGAVVAHEDDSEHANKWLEMIRARRAKGPRLSHGAEASPPSAISHSRAMANEAEAVTKPDLEAEPVLSEVASFDRQIDLTGQLEAEVKIVQRCPAAPARQETSQSVQRQTTAYPSNNDSIPQRARQPARPVRDQPVDAGASFLGGIEEASVEIVRHSGGPKARPGAADASPAAPDNKPAVNRFIKALNGG